MYFRDCWVGHRPPTYHLVNKVAWLSYRLL